MIAVTTMPITAMSIAVAATAIPSVSAPAAVPAAVIPRSSADEEPVHEPVRPIVAVRGAGVGIVGVIAPLADRSGIDHGNGDDRRADSNFFFNILSVCRCRKGQGQQHCHQNQA
jgi:hypothetical protein